MQKPAAEPPQKRVGGCGDLREKSVQEMIFVGKSYLVHLMYNHFDLNSDQTLTMDELQRLDEEGKYTKLMPTGCRLKDLLTHADSDGDGRLDEREFFRLFGKASSFAYLRPVPARCRYFRLASGVHFAAQRNQSTSRRSWTTISTILRYRKIQQRFTEGDLVSIRCALGQCGAVRLRGKRDN